MSKNGGDAVPSVATSWVVRSYRPDDEAGLLDLLSNAGDQWPPIHANLQLPEFLRWRWGLEGDSAEHLVVENGDRLVACLLLGKVRIKVGAESLTATEVVDGAVEEEYRGRGIMRALVEELVGRPAYGSDLLLFQGRHQPMRKLVEEFGVPKTRNTVDVLERPPFQGLRVSTAPAADSPIVVAEAKEFDPRSDQLWAAASHGFQLAIERGHEYLNRRYCDARGGKFRVRFATTRDELLGYVVLCVAKRTGYIVDLLAQTGRPEVVETLVRDALTEIDHASTSSAICAIPNEHPYRQCLVDLGFVLERRRVRLVPRMFAGRAVDWPYDADSSIHWTLGDTNLV